jgi:hypothetical protein
VACHSYALSSKLENVWFDWETLAQRNEQTYECEVLQPIFCELCVGEKPKGYDEHMKMLKNGDAQKDNGNDYARKSKRKGSRKIKGDGVS